MALWVAAKTISSKGRSHSSTWPLQGSAAVDGAAVAEARTSGREAAARVRAPAKSSPASAPIFQPGVSDTGQRYHGLGRRSNPGKGGESRLAAGAGGEGGLAPRACVRHTRGSRGGLPVNHEIRLASRPTGFPEATNFNLVETPIPEIGEGEVLVRNVYMSVDPSMRGRMNDVRSYVPPFQLGRPLEGRAVGQVERSRHADFAVGDYVAGSQGWRGYDAAEGSRLTRIDATTAPLSAHLGVLGGTGFTAYVGLLDIGRPKPGETVFVSGAAGGVGTVVGQIAKLMGCYVAGSAGSDAKVAFLREELGFDAAFNYRTVDLGRALREACPRGVDVYFDNVGGAHLQAALAQMNTFGRISLCGAISQYNDATPPPGPSNLVNAIIRRLTMTGFIIVDHADRRPDFLRDMSAWLRDGRVKNHQTVVQGIENAPAAFMGMLRGENMGKMLVQLSPEG
ncbi:MAG: NADP-dependent oxidoreductase [Dehalococcoidia bacterium]|nr:NADP-dependent oxidoreductase [Dehalococcoidia bacterium]